MVIHKAEKANRVGGDNYVFYFTALHTAAVAFLTVFVTRVPVQRGWLWTATQTAPPASLRKRIRSVAAQSQVACCVSNPLRSECRFAPLLERDQGC